jgi:thiamine-monophosphate kinase
LLLGFTLESVPYDPHSHAPGKTIGELLFIERIRTRASASFSNAVRLGIGDDCAILKPTSGHEILVTTDFSLEGRHFRRDWHSAASAGHRTLARGLSDLAAMGAKPLAAFLSLALPRSAARNTRWLDGFLDGLLTLANTHSVPLAGGDTSESPSDQILADIVLIGSAPAGRALRRSTARAGDLLYCTGSLGGAAAELAALAASPSRFRSAVSSGDHPHLFPQPRLAVGAALLRRRLASSCIDLSDGLSTDLAHLCTESNVTAEIDAASLPIHPLAQLLGPDHAQHAALHGGEDYELLFTARPTMKLPRSLGGVRVTKIGRILPTRKGRPQITLIDTKGHRSALASQGWEHLT